MQINSCLELSLFYYDLTYKKNSIHFEDIIHTHLKQSSSCIILGIDIIKKKTLYNMSLFFRST